jgi:hypothetical protein
MAPSKKETAPEEVQTGEGKGPNGSTDTTTKVATKDTTPNDQQSQSLGEDDSISMNGTLGRSAGNFQSSSESALTATFTTAVTSERKEALLAQARADRLAWIRNVPLPYKAGSKTTISTREASTEGQLSEIWERDPRLAELKNTFVVQQSASALQVLSHLYGISQESDLGTGTETTNNSLQSISERVGSILDRIKETEDDEDLATPTAEQIRDSALLESNADPVLQAYHAWVTRLSDPAAAILVQGMRRFCRMIGKEPRETFPSRLQGYLRSTSDGLREYIPWKSEETSEETKRSLESFLYGQCEDYVERLFWTEEAQVQEKEWLARLQSLQFVNASHLEIHCLTDTVGDLKEVLQKPVESLLSVDKYFSPFEKLQRILAIYRNINVALTGALNRANESGTRKLPSADDVLPSIILTVLIAKPARLLLNLELVEDLAPPEYLRGEAGYAFTNLYGAVQFLKDINLDTDNSESLHISAEDFQSGIKACRKAAEEKHARRRESGLLPVDSIAPTGQVLLQGETSIPVTEIRAARNRGEMVDIEWAKEWYAEKTDNNLVSSSDHNRGKHHAAAEESDGLPSGFTRSYTFLTSQPEDIKLSDLPQLLGEYKMLVHTAETLIGEKFAKAAAEKKAKFAAKQKEVYEAAQRVDPSLLPSSHSHSKRYTS